MTVITEWTLGTFYCRLFHMWTSHVSHYSRPTRNSSDRLRSQSPPHKTNTKPRDKQWPWNGTILWLSTPSEQTGQWGALQLPLPVAKKLLPVEVISQREVPVCRQQKHCFRGLACMHRKEHYVQSKATVLHRNIWKQKAKMFADLSAESPNSPVIWHSMT